MRANYDFEHFYFLSRFLTPCRQTAGLYLHEKQGQRKVRLKLTLFLFSGVDKAEDSFGESLPTMDESCLVVQIGHGRRKMLVERMDSSLLSLNRAIAFHCSGSTQ